MNDTLKYLSAVGLFATLFAPPASAQQVQLTLLKVKAGFVQTLEQPTTELVAQPYTVQVPYTETIEKTYQVEIPYTEKATQTYKVKVPYTEVITGDDGKEKEVEKYRIEERTRVVPIKKTKLETKTKQVPVQRMRQETRMRKVPVTRQNGSAKPIKFPPADAKFSYVSGEEISGKKIKELAAKTITILQLPAGKTLSKLQRQILKPDLVVMTTPRKENAAPKK